MRVHELAKKLEINEKELISLLKKKGVEVKNRMSVVDAKAAASIKPKKKFKKAVVKTAAKPKAKKAKQAKAKEQKPKKAKTTRKHRAKKVKAKVEKEVKIKEKQGGEEVSVEAAKEKVVVPVKEEAVVAPLEEKKKEVTEGLEILEMKLPITLKELAVKLRQKPNVLIKNLLVKGSFVTINQLLDEKSATGIAREYGFQLKNLPTLEETVISAHKEDKARLKPRQPVVTFMGHVDHGKTSLLDAIRKSRVVEREHGGITQHIGAHEVALDKGRITFLDTPGHEAFTAMRARGANITDLVVLVVAADDGIMPQTEEAINHARAAGVPIIVAINKIDKQQADPDRVKKQLAQRNLASEDWGGKTISVGVSAKTGEGIDNLLEMILLEAEMLELKADYEKSAAGVVVEARLSKGRGAVVTLLVQSGILKVTDTIICGNFYGKIKAMFNDHGHPVKEVRPAVPVEVLGLNGVPVAGEKFFVVSGEKEARQIVSEREKKIQSGEGVAIKRITLDDISLAAKEGKVRELRIILKADVQGSLGAVKDAIVKIDSQEVKLKIIHAAVGNVNNSDVVLAEASDAVIIGFNIVADSLAKETAEKEGVDIRIYRVIYEAINEIRQALEGLLEPKLKEKFLAKLVVRQVFDLSTHGVIAGCYVEKGSIKRNVNFRLKRDGQEILKGKVSSLKRFKDDVREVQEGYECGVGIGSKDIKAGDVIEAFDVEKIARKL